jgi:hypothetical protein
MNLPLDIARCEGVTLNTRKGDVMARPCQTCKRTEMPTGKKVRFFVMDAPEFKNGLCPKQIKGE